LRTSQGSLLTDSSASSAILPTAGLMRHGACTPLRTRERRTAGKGSSFSRDKYPTPTATPYGSSQNQGKVEHRRPTNGTLSLSTWARRSWPTPTAGDSKASSWRARGQFSLTDAATISRNGRQDQAPTNGRLDLNPRFVEWLMGLPIDWTACAHWGTQSFPSWQRRHSLISARS
jgi:hypothetical protein